VLNNEWGADEPVARIGRGVGKQQQRPQSVTITDPRTGKQRTISISEGVFQSKRRMNEYYLVAIKVIV
jgi:hypothetical protein